jgi:PKD repeat protein
MGRTLFSFRVIAGVAVSLLLAACTTHDQPTPALSGPSGLGTSLTVTVSPDTLNQDGVSQSLVQIAAFDNNGQPLRNVSMRAEIRVGGVATDFGRLSAKSLVTDGSGKTSVVYTAPAPVVGVQSEMLVDIAVTPSETDFANATPRFVTIHLVPTGVVGPPASLFVPDFAQQGTTTVGTPAVFTATFSGTDPKAQVVSFGWNFGDGSTGSGVTAAHTYNNIGTYLVTLTLVDSLGRSSSVSKSVTVGQGLVPTALIAPPSPSPFVVGQAINFNGAGSTAEPGHKIVDYSWNFGDGSFGSGSVAQHTYTTPGVYTVTLIVTDDVGRKSILATTPPVEVK